MNFIQYISELFTKTNNIEWKINVTGCRYERRVPQTTRDNSVKPPLIETLFALLFYNHT